jgi:hypothetical protein
MHSFRDNEYQDSRATGSLVGASRLWRHLLINHGHTKARHLAFALACTSESRALRVAAHLHRSRACAATRIDQIDAEPRTNWLVQGTTLPEVQSLANLEGLFTWLSRAAHAHQVRLVALELA